MHAWPAVVVDVICVLVFAIVGRRSHAEANDLLGVLGTAWPFLVGLGAGWLLARAWRAPVAVRTGVLVWLVTVALGMGLRLASGSTAQWPFVVVATLSLGVLLVGWRGGYRLLPAGRTPAGASRPGGGQARGSRSVE